MRTDDVPVRDDPLFEGQRKIAYVVDAQGRYVLAGSGGSEAEVAVTEAAVAWFAQLAEDARQRALRGETSALEYHMFRQRMDIPTLAQATGLWEWQVRRHLRPEKFAQLNPRLLERYAEAMGLSVGQLRTLT